jgi:hypothetical protein
MKQGWSRLVRYWRFAAMLASGMIALVVLPTETFMDVTQELMALFGLLMAGVLPTMVLTASVLRPGNLSIRKLTRYREALRRQMLVWIGLFVVSFFSSLLVVLGKMLHWKLELNIPSIWEITPAFQFDAIRVLNALLMVGLVLVVTRIISVGNGVLSLLGLSAELALGEAQNRNERKFNNADAAVKEMPERERFGEYVDLQH